MFLDPYYHISNEKISFTRQQASDFAKKIADDFNPLHDVNAKRFCVPGDLLFSLVLTRVGLCQEMEFKFSGMVSDEVALNFPSAIENHASISDDNHKDYMHISASGERTKDTLAIESLIRAYVAFSGHTFPHILVKLMTEKNVMINPARPMVMYESMSIHLDQLNFTQVDLIESNSTLSIDGKRGNACLAFDLLANGDVIGHGKKHMLLSGLSEFCQQKIDDIVTEYNHKKAQFGNAA